MGDFSHKVQWREQGRSRDYNALCHLDALWDLVGEDFVMSLFVRSAWRGLQDDIEPDSVRKEW